MRPRYDHPAHGSDEPVAAWGVPGGASSSASTSPPNFGVQGLDRPVPVEPMNAGGMLVGERVVGRRNAVIKRLVLCLHAVAGRVVALGAPGTGGLGVEFYEVGAVGHEAVRHATVKGLQPLRIGDVAAGPLIGRGRVVEAIADDNPPRLQRRPDALGHKLGPGGREQKQLCHRMDV